MSSISDQDLHITVQILAGQNIKQLPDGKLGDLIVQSIFQNQTTLLKQTIFVSNLNPTLNVVDSLSVKKSALPLPYKVQLLAQEKQEQKRTLLGEVEIQITDLTLLKSLPEWYDLGDNAGKIQIEFSAQNKTPEAIHPSFHVHPDAYVQQYNQNATQQYSAGGMYPPNPYEFTAPNQPQYSYNPPPANVSNHYPPQFQAHYPGTIQQPSPVQSPVMQPRHPQQAQFLPPSVPVRQNPQPTAVPAPGYPPQYAAPPNAAHGYGQPQSGYPQQGYMQVPPGYPQGQPAQPTQGHQPQGYPGQQQQVFPQQSPQFPGTPQLTHMNSATNTLKSSAHHEGYQLSFREITFGPKIAAGAYGEIYKGEWTGTTVAIKKIIKTAINPADLEEFSKEILLMSKLRHPNIVQFLGACFEPEICLVTEFMERGSLFDVLAKYKTTPLDWKLRIRFCTDIASGILYLHTRTPAIIHRDIKSLNILVTKDWKCTVSDFGLTKIKDKAMLSTRCGSPAWSAPEVLRGLPYNEKADVYSYGIVMWEIISHNPPYPDLAPNQLIGLIAYQKPPFRPPVPSCPYPLLLDIMKQCWDDNPDARPGLADVVNKLKPFLQ